MAAGKPESADAAKQAEAAAAAVQKSAAALKPILEGLRYADELRLLDEFRQQFESYRTVEKQIHGFLIESSNVTAQQMAFGPGNEAADAVERQVQATAGRAAAPAMWQARALANSVNAAVRQIQVLQARHIPENDDAVMDGIERQMAGAEKTARESSRGLSAIVQPSGDAAAVNTALDRFMSLNAEITRLSRRNTNVHALALALGTQGAYRPVRRHLAEVADGAQPARLQRHQVRSTSGLID